MDQQERTDTKLHSPAARPHHDHHPDPKLGKRLPRKAQLTLLLFAVALIVAGFIAGPAALHLLGITAP
jgi:hypothetical protein